MVGQSQGKRLLCDITSLNGGVESCGELCRQRKLFENLATSKREPLETRKIGNEYRTQWRLLESQSEKTNEGNRPALA